MKTTKGQIEGIFKVWVREIGGHIAVDYKDVDGYRLDHNSVYGGWRIEQICNEQGGVRDVMTTRMPSTQFWQALHFAVRSMQEKSAPVLG